MFTVFRRVFGDLFVGIRKIVSDPEPGRRQKVRNRFEQFADAPNVGRARSEEERLAVAARRIEEPRLPAVRRDSVQRQDLRVVPRDSQPGRERGYRRDARQYANIDELQFAQRRDEFFTAAVKARIAGEERADARQAGPFPADLAQYRNDILLQIIRIGDRVGIGGVVMLNVTQILFVVNIGLLLLNTVHRQIPWIFPNLL